MPENEFKEAMTIHDASDYWDEHEFGEFDDVKEIENIQFDLKKKKYVGINPSLFSLISKKAKEMRMSEEKLITLWLNEKIGNEA